MTIVLRFTFGFILAAGLEVWLAIPFPGNVLFVLTIATIAAVWGDKFLLGFMSLMRYFR